MRNEMVVDGFLLQVAYASLFKYFGGGQACKLRKSSSIRSRNYRV